MTDQAQAMQDRVASFFPGTLGIRITSATPDRVTAELDVRDELCTVPGICHGGVLMAFADTLGAVGGYAEVGLSRSKACSVARSRVGWGWS